MTGRAAPWGRKASEASTDRGPGDGQRPAVLDQTLALLGNELRQLGVAPDEPVPVFPAGPAGVPHVRRHLRKGQRQVSQVVGEGVQFRVRAGRRVDDTPEVGQ
ncbi:hypothetical protein GCM10020254_80910 [Streptomyces goshikiensis]